MDSGKKNSGDRHEYQREYYLKNKEELSNKKKDRYRSDPEVRRKAKEASRLYRIKKKAERDRMRANGELPPSRTVGPRKPITVDIKGVAHFGYTITAMAERIGRSVDTINNWINIGTIPKTPLRSSRGDRLYTDGMILAVKLAIQSRGVVGKDDKDIYKAIADSWMEIGLDL